MFRIIKYENRIQVHHITCSRRNTKIISWDENVPGGMDLEVVQLAVESHKCDQASEGRE